MINLIKDGFVFGVTLYQKIGIISAHSYMVNRSLLAEGLTICCLYAAFEQMNNHQI
jgi:hypothetical protein